MEHRTVYGQFFNNSLFIIDVFAVINQQEHTTNALTFFQGALLASVIAGHRDDERRMVLDFSGVESVDLEFIRGAMGPFINNDPDDDILTRTTYYRCPNKKMFLSFIKHRTAELEEPIRRHSH